MAELLKELLSVSKWINIPNILSLFRIVLIPVFLYALNLDQPYGIYIAFGILAISYLTDILDGYIARKHNMTTEVGKILDPLADKATQIVVIIALVVKGLIPMFVLVIIAVKELLMIGGGAYIYFVLKDSMIPSNIFGKTATGLFYVSVLLLLLKVPFAIYLVYLTTAIMVVAFFSYLIAFIKYRKEKKTV
jgi:cardiolipin synthase